MTNNLYLKKWCERYKETTSIPVFHQAAPLDVVVDDLLRSLEIVNQSLDNMLARLLGIEEQIKEIKKETTKELEKEAKSVSRRPIKKDEKT